jgi:hypothetical protein
VMSGAFMNTFDTSATSTYNAAFITANGGTTAGVPLVKSEGFLQCLQCLNQDR